MSVRRWYQAVCDNPSCDNAGKVFLDALQDGSRMVQEGWRVWHGADLCPGCWDLVLDGHLIMWTYASGTHRIVDLRRAA